MQRILCLIVVVFLLGMTALFVPEGLSPAAWRLFGVFLSAIAALVLRPFPEPVIMLLAVTLAAFWAVPLPELLAGYMDGTLWLTVSAMIMSLGLRRSGLAERIGLLLICRFGQTSLRMGYVLSSLDMLLAVSTPASPARTGGIVFPLTMGVLDACRHKGTGVQRGLAAYLILLIYMASMAAGSLFLTGMAPNLINASFAQRLLGLDITWNTWFLAALPGWLCFFATPYLVYRLCPPGIASLAVYQAETEKKLQRLGKVSGKEYLVLFIFLCVLGLWSTASMTGVNMAAAGLLGVSLMLLSGVLGWEDLSKADGVWALWIWFGAILGFSGALMQEGFFAWFTQWLDILLTSVDLPQAALWILLALLAVFPHYLFASLGGYVASMAPLLCSFVIVSGLPRYPAFFLFAFLMVVSSSLTHYGNALGPMLMGTGLVSKALWWRTGLLLSIFQMLFYLVVGIGYWQLLGWNY